MKKKKLLANILMLVKFLFFSVTLLEKKAVANEPLIT